MAITLWKTIKLHDPDNNKEDVKELQGFWNTKFSFLFNKEALVEDGIFGHLTDAAVEISQNYLMLERDGIVGPITRFWYGQYSRYNEIRLINDNPEFKVFGRYWAKPGWIPNGYGLCSTFGGPIDPGDNMCTQSYINTCSTPSELAAHNPELLNLGILRHEIRTIGAFPMVKLFNRKNAKGNQIYVRSSTSWALDPTGFFCALRTKGSFDMKDEHNPRVVIINPQTGKIVVCLRTDYGPAKRTDRVIDISKGAMKALGEITDGDLIFGWARPDTPLGFIGEITHCLM